MKPSTVFVAAVAIATLVPISMALSGVGMPRGAAVGLFNGQDSSVQDPVGDAVPVLQHANASVIPETKPYHDITSASIRKTGEDYRLTIYLSGNPNLNEKYETNYMWNLILSEPLAEDRYYIVMFLNFAPDFNHTAQGWHYAVFDRTADRYVLPQTKIGEMPDDRVEFDLDGELIGNPASLRYWVSVYSRVNNTSFETGPEYLMDYAP